MLPKTRVLLITKSIVFPANALKAGTDVIAAINNTKIKLAFALNACEKKGIEIIPAMGNIKDKKISEKSFIDI
jgi:hypothetical protein